MNLKSIFNKYIDWIWILGQFASFIHNPLVFLPTINSFVLIFNGWGYHISPLNYVLLNVGALIFGVIGGSILIRFGWASRNIELGNRQNQMAKDTLEIVKQLENRLGFSSNDKDIIKK